MHILICSPITLHSFKELVHNGADLPGGEVYAFAAQLAHEYLNQGHKVSIVTLRSRFGDTKIWKGKNIQIAVSSYRRAYLFTLDGYKKEANELKRVILNFNPDIIHANWTYEFAAAGLKSGLPCVVNARDFPLAIFKYLKTPYRLWRHQFSKPIIMMSKNIVFNSDYLYNRYTRYYKRSFEKIIIPNGVGKDIYCDSYKSSCLQSPVFLSIAQNTKLKNPKATLLAFKKVVVKYPKSSLIFIGTGLDNTSNLYLLAKKHNISSNISFLGYKKHSEIISIMRNKADIFINTSREESFGAVIAEAMANSLPVIAGRESGAVPWVLDYGKAGKLVDIDNIDEISNAMIEFIKYPDRANEFAKKSFERAVNVFSIKSIASQFVNHFKTVLSE